MKQYRDRKQGDADVIEFLRPFVALAMCPEYQARRLAEEARRKAEVEQRKALRKARQVARTAITPDGVELDHR